jgi:ABC-type transporter Mla subunit MlaD
MSIWMQLLVTLCVVAATAVLIPAAISMRRSLQRAETVLLLLEAEIGPLAAQLRGLTEDLRTLVRQANRELERVGDVAERVGALSDKAARLVSAVSGFTRVGQVLGAATGIKKGVSVFLHRIRSK